LAPIEGFGSDVTVVDGYLYLYTPHGAFPNILAFISGAICDNNRSTV
jgi:hypothetical protein